MSVLSTLREDVATVVAAALGITCVSTFSGNPEPNMAYVRWGAGGGPWLDFNEQAFKQPAVALTVVITSNSADLIGAQVDLEEKIVALLDIGGTALDSGGRCPPVMSVSEPGSLFEDVQLLAVEARLAPVPRQL